MPLINPRQPVQRSNIEQAATPARRTTIMRARAARMLMCCFGGSNSSASSSNTANSTEPRGRISAPTDAEFSRRSSMRDSQDRSTDMQERRNRIQDLLRNAYLQQGVEELRARMSAISQIDDLQDDHDSAREAVNSARRQSVELNSQLPETERTELSQQLNSELSGLHAEGELLRDLNRIYVDSARLETTAVLGDYEALTHATDDEIGRIKHFDCPLSSDTLNLKSPEESSIDTPVLWGESVYAYDELKTWLGIDARHPLSKAVYNEGDVKMIKLDAPTR